MPKENLCESRGSVLVPCMQIHLLHLQGLGFIVFHCKITFFFCSVWGVEVVFLENLLKLHREAEQVWSDGTTLNYET